MTRAPIAAIAPLALAALAAWASPAMASLTPGEAEEIRHDVAVVQAPSRVRALVARPDLTSGEAGAAMSAAIVTSPLDASHVAFLRELVFGAASSTSRPVVAVAVVRGVLSRVDALLAQHPSDLDRSRAALAEIAAGYGLVEEVVASDERDSVTSSARADCARALKEHVAHNPAALRPDAPVGVGVAVARAQVAIALFDALPATPVRRVDAADALGLEGRVVPCCSKPESSSSIRAGARRRRRPSARRWIACPELARPSRRSSSATNTRLCEDATGWSWRCHSRPPIQRRTRLGHQKRQLLRPWPRPWPRRGL